MIENRSHLLDSGHVGDCMRAGILTCGTVVTVWEPYIQMPTRHPAPGGAVGDRRHRRD
ncbi:MAG TPA: hypothetical protein VGG07_20845 [Solirubrobacteraceae bacterium]